MMSTIASTSSLQNNNKQSTVQNKKTTSSCLPTATTSTLSSTTVDDRAASLISPSQSTSSTTNSTTSSTNSLSAFGGRCLTDPDHVFTQNAWDHVEFSPSTLAWAETQLAYQRSTPCDSPNLTSLAQPWNQFYSQHQDRFFKHRHWLPIEFPELFSWEDPPLTLTTNENGNGNGNTKYIMEVGCGVGNTVFPLLEHMAFIRTLEPSSPSNMPDVRIVACDFSVTAIDVLKNHPSFDPTLIQAFVYDVTSKELPKDIPPNSMDCILLIFVLSALVPSSLEQAILNVKKLLKPGGHVFIRDYARLDLAQLRFRKHRWIDEDFYVRGDATLVHFFNEERLTTLMKSHEFLVLQVGLDQRLLVNRGKQLQMHRRWIQGKFQLVQSEVNHSINK